MSDQTGTKTQTPMSVEDACSDAVLRVMKAVPIILDKLIEQAKGGSYQHAKFLLDWAKIEPEYQRPSQKETGPSLAQMLLDRLREDTGQSACESTTKVL